MTDRETFPGQHLGGEDTSPLCRLQTSPSPYVERHSRGLGICRLLPYKGHSLGPTGGLTSSFVGRYLTFLLIDVQRAVLDGSGDDFIACHRWTEQSWTAGKQGGERSAEQQDIRALPSWDRAFWSPGKTPLTLLVAEGLMRGALLPEHAQILPVSHRVCFRAKTSVLVVLPALSRLVHGHNLGGYGQSYPLAVHPLGAGYSFGFLQAAGQWSFSPVTSHVCFCLQDGEHIPISGAWGNSAN